MHPNPYLQTFWRLDLKPQVFVAISFDPRYQARFQNVIAPAISAITDNGVALQPYRVDLSKSGEKGTEHLLEANCLISLGWLFTSSAGGCAVKAG